MDKVGKSNKYIRNLCSVLKECLEREVEVGKISDITICLERMGVSVKSPLLRHSLTNIKNRRLPDGLWSTPLITAQNIEIFFKNGIDTEEQINALKEWMIEGLWGHSDRDIPRLACSSEIIECIINSNAMFVKENAELILETNNRLWERDIELTPYTFKAVSYLFIRSQLSTFIPLGIDAQDSLLLNRTLQLFVKTLNGRKSVPYILCTNIGICDLHYMINFYKSLLILQKNIPDIAEKLEEFTHSYLERNINMEFKPTTHQELCDYSYAYHIIN